MINIVLMDKILMGMWGNILKKVVCGVYVEFMIKDGEKEMYLEKLDI